MVKIFDENIKQIESPVDVGLEPVGEYSGVTDIRAIQLLEQILTVMQKIEYHLFLATDTELKDQDVGV